MTTGVSVISAASTAASISLCRSVLRPPLVTPPFLSLSRAGRTRKSLGIICCGVALKPESSTSDPSESEEFERKLKQVGSRVSLKAPLKVYHVPRVPEVELAAGTEGVIKQYVGFWKGKRISANLPYKVEFQIDVHGRGPVKFFAHLKEDEFDFI